MRGYVGDCACTCGGSGGQGGNALLSYDVTGICGWVGDSSRLTHRNVAHVRSPGGPTSAAERLFRLGRPSSIDCVLTRLIGSNRRTQGGVGGEEPKGSPYPDQCPLWQVSSDLFNSVFYQKYSVTWPLWAFRRRTGFGAGGFDFLVSIKASRSAESILHVARFPREMFTAGNSPVAISR